VKRLICQKILVINIYDGYQSPFGMAWAPNKNLIEFIGGYNDSARINLYHFKMEENYVVNIRTYCHSSNFYKPLYV
jgi:hypothetical protein